jgi:hypothetical protein
VKNATIVALVLLLTGYANTDVVHIAAGKPVLTITGPYGGGDGTAENPYQIYTAEQMNEIGANPNDWNKYFTLMADIDLSEYNAETFNVIGYYRDSSDNKPFGGVFNGNNNTIFNFSYTSTDKDYAGIFGYVHGVYAQIKNLNLANTNINTGGHTIGSLVGLLRKGNISYCRTKNCNISGAMNVGGLVGRTAQDTMGISNCSSSGFVSGDDYIGGLIGQIGPGTVSMCYSKANVSGNRNVGGLVGKTGDETSVVRDCYATGNVEGYEYVGGLAGQVERGAVYKCYSVGGVSGNHSTGGLTGYVRVMGTVLHCVWDTQSSGQTTSAGGTGKTTEQMKMISTFTSMGWNFGITWEICDGMNYPVLLWQIPDGDFLCPDGVNFIDFAFFAQHWLRNNCNDIDYCRGTDLDKSGSVGVSDLAVFAENWLEGTQ